MKEQNLTYLVTLHRSFLSHKESSKTFVRGLNLLSFSCSVSFTLFLILILICHRSVTVTVMGNYYDRRGLIQAIFVTLVLKRRILNLCNISVSESGGQSGENEIEVVVNPSLMKGQWIGREEESERRMILPAEVEGGKGKRAQSEDGNHTIREILLSSKVVLDIWWKQVQ